jgi:hypothetical protein
MSEPASRNEFRRSLLRYAAFPDLGIALLSGPGFADFRCQTIHLEAASRNFSVRPCRYIFSTKVTMK